MRIRLRERKDDIALPANKFCNLFLLLMLLLQQQHQLYTMFYVYNIVSFPTLFPCTSTRRIICLTGVGGQCIHRAELPVFFTYAFKLTEAERKSL